MDAAHVWTDPASATVLQTKGFDTSFAHSPRVRSAQQRTAAERSDRNNVVITGVMWHYAGTCTLVPGLNQLHRVVRCRALCAPKFVCMAQLLCIEPGNGVVFARLQ